MKLPEEEDTLLMRENWGVSTAERREPVEKRDELFVDVFVTGLIWLVLPAFGVVFTVSKANVKPT